MGFKQCVPGHARSDKRAWLLHERYATAAQGRLGQLIKAAIGVLLIGTGLIAVLAFN